MSRDNWVVHVLLPNGLKFTMPPFRPERIGKGPLIFYWVEKRGYGRLHRSTTTDPKKAKALADEINAARSARLSKRRGMDRSRLSNRRRKMLATLGADWEVRQPGQYALLTNPGWEGDGDWHVVESRDDVRDHILENGEPWRVVDLDTGKDIDVIVSVRLKAAA